MIPPSLDDLLHPPGPTASRALRLAWLLPAGLVLGFTLLFLALFRDRLLPAPDVEVATALALPSSGLGPEAESRFQASGWVEPDPQPLRVTCLTDGVVESVHAQEGDLVRKGDLLAVLVGADAELAASRFRRKAERAEAVRSAHAAAIATARQRLALAEAQARAAAALRDESADVRQRLESLPAGAVAQADVVAARLRWRREEAQAQAAELGVAEARAEVGRLELETAARDAEVAEAGVELAEATLALERTRITAPADGRVLSLHATPGGKRMLGSDEPESATVAVLYDPARLQVRVDVPLADASRLRLDQSARIHTALLAGRELTGTVSRLAGAADIQRNTLQAKVRIHDPPAELRPEMLCRVTFADVPAPGGRGASASAGAPEIWVPLAAVAEDAVWICDPDTRRVSRRPLRLAGPVREGLAAVASGLRPGEWVVLSPPALREGRRVNVRRGAP